MNLITDIKALDNLDDRREVWRLLHRLKPTERFDFLGWACKQVPAYCRPQPSAIRMRRRVLEAMAGDEVQDNALTNEVYTDIFMLVLQYGLSARVTAAKLERVVRERKR